MHGSTAAVEQNGKRFRGQVDAQVEHGGQDLVGEGGAGRASAPGVSCRRQGVDEVLQLVWSQAGQFGVGQDGWAPRWCRWPAVAGCRGGRARLGVQGVIPFAVEGVPGQRQGRHLRVADTDADG